MFFQTALCTLSFEDLSTIVPLQILEAYVQGYILFILHLVSCTQKLGTISYFREKVKNVLYPCMSHGSFIFYEKF